ncbi:TPA: hypothetical protein I8370_003603 [Klebsiella oxytoca]|nr:hypothetical protein [Klebsiella oxytoca]
MSIIVLTDHFFILSGCARASTQKCTGYSRLCIIDIINISRLNEIKHYILTELTPVYFIVFIKGRDILSKMLSPLAGIQRCTSLTEYRRNLSERKWYTAGQALAVVTNFRELHNLTKLDIAVACALRSQNTLRALSPILHYSKKVTYQRVTSIVRKMNFSYSTQLLYFLQREYTIQELKRMNNKPQECDPRDV